MPRMSNVAASRPRRGTPGGGRAESSRSGLDDVPRIESLARGCTGASTGDGSGAGGTGDASGDGDMPTVADPSGEGGGAGSAGEGTSSSTVRATRRFSPGTTGPPG